MLILDAGNVFNTCKQRCHQNLCPRTNTRRNRISFVIMHYYRIISGIRIASLQRKFINNLIRFNSENGSKCLLYFDGNFDRSTFWFDTMKLMFEMWSLYRFRTQTTHICHNEITSMFGVVRLYAEDIVVKNDVEPNEHKIVEC